MPHHFSYVWRYGVQCHGVDGRPGESCFWQDVMARLVSVQDRLRAWWHRCFSFDCRPYVGFEGAANGRPLGAQQSAWRRLVAPSPTVLEMVMQHPGWCWDGGDGRTGPMATKVTGLAGLTSRRSPVWAWSSRPSPLRGLRHHLLRARRVSRTGVGGTVSRDIRLPCRTVSHSGRDGLTGGVGGIVPGRDSQARRGFFFDSGAFECQYIKCPCRGGRYGGSGPVRSSSEAEPRSRGRPAPERGKTSPEGATSPQARRSFTNAAPCPTSEVEFRPRVVRPTAWWAVGLWVHLTCVFRFVCVCFSRG
jgi:hypothetical protein